ncbi:MAG: hypothetical protein AAF902_07680, partial [Chloroflexota bacterium]
MEKSADAWEIPVIKASAAQQTGITAVVDAILEHKQHLENTGQILERNRQKYRAEIENILVERVLAQYLKSADNPALDQLLDDLVERKIDPYSVVDELLNQRVDARD